MEIIINLNPPRNIMEQATFGAGCFWGVEETFRKLPGVKETAVGYMGGHLKNPRYEDVCSDRSGHVEVVHIDFDPKKIAFKKLLDAFFSNHDPTQVNRQGPDFGTQYRSAVFYHSEKQKKDAEEIKKELDKSKKFSKPIATAIEPASEFYRAEEYHQKYLLNNPSRVCNF